MLGQLTYCPKQIRIRRREGFNGGSHRIRLNVSENFIETVLGEINTGQTRKMGERAFLLNIAAVVAVFFEGSLLPLSSDPPPQRIDLVALPTAYCRVSLRTHLCGPARHGSIPGTSPTPSSPRP